MQIHITYYQVTILKHLATETGLSLPKLIRKILDKFLQTANLIDIQEQRLRSNALAGKFNDGLPDLSMNHDKYLENAIEQ